MLAAMVLMTAMAPGGVPQTRLDRLGTGANVCLWFRPNRPQDAAHYADYVSDDEMDAMRRIGLRHIRLCITPQLVMEPETGAAKPEPWRAVERAIDRFHAHGLAVVVDMHNENRKDEADPGWWSKFDSLWKDCATRLAKTDPNTTFMEIVNEPVFPGHAADWFPIQERLAATIRAAAPRHTIVATGPNWSNIDGGLLLLKPLKDRNVVYTFHCYDPHTFTHQGATWSSKDEEPLRSVPYPSSPEAVAPLLPGLPPDARTALARYGEERWNRERMRQNFAQAVDWGKRYKVPLYCGEFGVYPRFSPPESRAAWFRDFGGVLKENGIGWASWGWDEGFGFNRRHQDGKIVVDEVVVKALGLKTL